MSISIALQKLLEAEDISKAIIVICIFAIIGLSGVVGSLFFLLIREMKARMKDSNQLIRYMDKLTGTFEEQAKSSKSVLAVLRYSKCFKCILQKEDEEGCADGNNKK